MKLLGLFALLLLSTGIVSQNVFSQEQQKIIPISSNWMLDKEGNPVHWLGRMYKGRKLYEPVNVIIYDKYSTSVEMAIKKLMHECKINGYEEEIGHSSGYFSKIDGVLYAQIPNNKRMAFSDKDFLQSNNHGRIFGPALINGEYIFVGAFSRESFQLFTKVHHGFVSFTIARDNFCQKLNDGDIYKIDGSFNLGNILNDDEGTSADHDGKAIILVA
jgi:hypothetical protein